MDKLTVQVEVTPELFADDARVMNNLREKLREEMSALITIKPVIELTEPGSIPQAETKAKRVNDLRPKA